MLGSQWNYLQTTVDTKIQSINTNYNNTFFTAFEFNHAVTSSSMKYYHRKKPISPPMSYYLDFNGGGTNFDAALNKATQIINNFSGENTYFYFITDGEDNWSNSTANAYVAAMNKVKQNCLGRTYCIQIDDSNQYYQGQFYRLCKHIGASYEKTTSVNLAFRVGKLPL